MMTVSSKNYIQQCIKIRLNTELDTIRGNTDMGCNLHTIIHSNIPNNKLKGKVEEMIKESIQDILPNASVSISFLNTDYLNYHDSIRVVIVNNEDIYYYTV
jgi:phage baseplate assembly protein W